MSLKLSRKTDCGSGISSTVANSMLDNTGIPQANTEIPGRKLLFDTVTVSDVINHENFNGIPLPGIITRIRTSHAIVAVGTCPLCGVMAMWPKITFRGDNDNPSVDQELSCNCNKCGFSWNVIDGKIVEKTK